LPAPDREEVRASPSRAGISRPPDYSGSIADAVHPLTGCRSPLEIGVSKESFREPWDKVLSPDPGSPDPGG